MDGEMLCFSYFHFLSEAAVKNMGWKIDILTLPPHSGNSDNHPKIVSKRFLDDLDQKTVVFCAGLNPVHII